MFNNENGFVNLPVARMVAVYDILLNPPWLAAPCEITIAAVQQAIVDGRLNPLSFSEFILDMPLDDWTVNQHIERIAYLVVHGWPDPIEVDVGVPSLGYQPKWPVQDGNHRLAAAIVRGDKTIPAYVSGECKLIRQLFGDLKGVVNV